ncbi:hypothetical protein ACHAXR_000398, partial [Thalassiosira sp. AJA248-18]
MKSLLLLLTATTAAPWCISAFQIPQKVARSSPYRHAPSTNIIKGNTVHNAPSSSSSFASSTSLAAIIPATATLAAAGASIAKFYKASPLIAGFLTASTKAGLADSLAQYRDVYSTKFDVKRNLAMVLYSGFVLGISVELMYNHAFPLLFSSSVASTPLVMAVKKTLFDGFVNAPLLWLPPAYIAKAFVYRYPKREGIQKYITDVKDNGLLKKYWMLWLPMSMINFLFIPAHFRVAFVAGVSFFWMIILSMVANNKSGEEEE